MPRFYFFDTHESPLLIILGGLRVNSYNANKENELKTLVYLTEMRTRPIVFLWEELTPRGNMVHQGIER
jgi:hypothetical protein